MIMGLLISPSERAVSDKRAKGSDYTGFAVVISGHSFPVQNTNTFFFANLCTINLLWVLPLSDEW